MIDAPPMSVEALQDAIRKPAALLGVRFDPEDMPAYLAGATAREAGALPLLAYLLSDMWQAMQGAGDGVLRRDVSQLLDVSAALRERAERFYARNEAREGSLQRLFTLRLAQVPRLGDVIKRRARREECAPEEWSIAEALAGEEWRLVTLAGQQSGDVAAEVAHEQILRKWPRLARWLDTRREFLVWKAEVEGASLFHEQSPDQEKRGALLTGRHLLIARQWLASHGEDLAEKERVFIEASIKADDEAKQRADEQEREARAQERKMLFRTRMGLAVALAALHDRGRPAACWPGNNNHREQQDCETASTEELRRQTQITESGLLANAANAEFGGSRMGNAVLLALDALPDAAAGVARPTCGRGRVATRPRKQGLARTLGARP